MSLSPIANAVVLKNLHAAVLILDVNNQIIELNPAAENLLATTESEAIGKKASDLFPNQQHIIEKFRDIDELITELMVNDRYFELHINPLFDKDVFLGRVVILHEITAHKKTELALKQQTDRLALLYRIRTDSQIPLEEKLQEALALTTKVLEMEIGIISGIDELTYAVEYVHSASPTIQKGEIFELGSTYCNITMATDEVVAINYVKHSPFSGHPCYANTGLEAYIGTRIWVNGRVHGTLNFSSSKPRKKVFKQADKDFVNLLANWIGSALERYMSNTELRSNLSRMQALYQVTDSLIRFADLPNFLQTVTDRVATTLPANRVTLIIIDTEKKRVSHLIRGGKGAQYIKSVTYEELAEGLTGWVLRKGKPAISPKNVPDPRESPEVQKRRAETNCGAILVVPVHYQDQIIGTLTAINLPDEKDFDTDDSALLEALANQTAIAVENRRLLEAERHRTQELEQSNKQLDTFSHTVAHDLKSPLSLILGYTEFLMMDQPEGQSDIRLERILGSAKKMGNIIDELLLLANVRQNQVQTQPIVMKFIVDEAIQRLSHIIEENNIQLIKQTEWPIALGYAPWIEEVWVNYMSNAIKYGGNPPIVQLGANQLEDDTIRFWVKDNGKGISREDEAKLFQKFERFDETRATGHGLGLSIVKQIIEILGGEVGFEQQHDQGSLFYFTLPIAIFDET